MQNVQIQQAGQNAVDLVAERPHDGSRGFQTTVIDRAKRCRRGATIETLPTMKCVLLPPIQSSLRDETFLCCLQPWVETHGYHQSSLCDKTKAIGYGTVGFDVETNRRLGLLFPWLTGDHWLCLGPVLFFFWGHYRGSPGVEDQFVYVALFPDGSQRTYTPAEFAKQFNLLTTVENGGEGRLKLVALGF